MLEKRKIIFRADGNQTIGFGHFFRVLALAEVLQTKFHIYLAIENPCASILEHVNSLKIGLISLPAIPYAQLKQSFAKEVNFDLEEFVHEGEIVVLDGYLFSDNYQRQLKSKGCSIVYIDDIYQNYTYADVIINHSISATIDSYQNTAAAIYTGPKYSLLRKVFLDEAKQNIKKNKFDTAFICFGGSDPEELAYKTLCLLLSEKAQFTTIHILMGSSYNGEVSKFEKKASETGLKILVYQNLSSSEVLELMKNSDLGIVSASNIAYECACAKLPMVLGYYEDHQFSFYKALSGQSNTEGIGRCQNASAVMLGQKIASLIQNYNPSASPFIDGMQQTRLLNIFESLASG